MSNLISDELALIDLNRHHRLSLCVDEIILKITQFSIIPWLYIHYTVSQWGIKPSYFYFITVYLSWITITFTHSHVLQKEYITITVYIRSRYRVVNGFLQGFTSLSCWSWPCFSLSASLFSLTSDTAVINTQPHGLVSVQYWARL